MSEIKKALENFDSNHKIIKTDAECYEFTIRTRIGDETNYNDSCLMWLQKFSKLTCTQWIVAKSYPNVKKLEFRKDFLCQHSAKNKKRKNESSRNRNKDCKAKTIFNIKKMNKFTRYRDPYLKDNLNAVIVINFKHNHRVNVAEAYSFLRITLETKEQFIKYFEDGMSPSEAKGFHKASLLTSTPTEDLCHVLANAQINPTDRTIYDIYEKWRQENYGDRTVMSVVAKLQEKILHLQAKGFKISVNEEPFCCVILTPLMLRAHGLQFSSEIIFVDSSGSCDQGGSSVTFLFGASKVGGIPLGCIIHNYQTEEVYDFCFKKFKDLLGAEGFYRKEYPMVIMTDDSAPERNALHNVFPNSVTLLCTFHVLQATWRWLWDNSNGIKKEDRRPLMLQFRDILYAKNDIDCELFKNTLCNSSVAIRYDKFLHYFNHMWERKSEWCHCFRSNLHTKGHNTNNIIEVSIRIFKDLVLQRCKAFNAAALVDFVCFSLEQFYKQKLIGFANSRGMKLQVYFKKFCHKSALLKVTKITDVEFRVTSSSDEMLLYTVDVAIEQCDCPAGASGKFCKHLCAVYNSGVNLVNTPDLPFQDRVELATLALGNTIDKDFFMEMDKNIVIPNDVVEDFENPMNIQNLENQIGDENEVQKISEVGDLQSGSVTDSTTETKTDTFPTELKKFKENLNKLYHFAEAHPSKHMLKNVVDFNSKIETVDNEESFYNICSAVANIKKSRRIKVQPTSIARRLNRGLHVGTRAIQAGRPSNAEGIKKKRPRKKRSLATNIYSNTTNALSHGSGH